MGIFRLQTQKVSGSFIPFSSILAVMAFLTRGRIFCDFLKISPTVKVLSHWHGQHYWFLRVFSLSCFIFTFVSIVRVGLLMLSVNP